MAASTAASTAATRKSSSAREPERLADFLADVGAQLLEGVELGGVGGELVVELGQDFLPHLFHLDREDRVFAGQVLGLVVLGEGDLDLDLVAGLGAGQLLLEALDQRARAELQQVVLGLAALEGAAVERALEVDQQRVALGGRALDRLEPGEALADPLDLGVDDLVGDLVLFAADLEPLVLAELGRRPHPDLEFELERLALVLGGRDHLDRGVADRADAGRRAAPVRTTRAAPRGSPPRAPGRSRAAGSPATAAPCPCGSRAAASRWPARGRRARWRGSTSSAGTSTSTRTRESGSSVSVVCIGPTLEESAASG